MKIARLAILLFGVVILMQFNNCSPMANTNGFNSNSILSTCDPNNIIVNGTNQTNPNADVNNVNCAVADGNNLQINPQGGDIAVAANQADFNVAGTCNEGGYPSNAVSWTLKYNNVMVRNSGMIFQNQSWNGQCINGRFSLYVNLSYTSSLGPAEDPNNRTGLSEPTTGTRQPYTLDISIVGFDANGVPHINNIFGVRTINLNPL